MLIDCVLSEPRLPVMLGPVWSHAAQQIAMSQKFIIGEHFALAAEALSGDLEQLHRTLTFCRLPYPSIWIEVAQAHRPEYASPAHPLQPGQRPCDEIVRVGWWITALRPKLDIWQATMFWKFKPPNDDACQICIYAMAFNGGESDADVEEMAKTCGSIVKPITMTASNTKFQAAMNMGRIHICVPRHAMGFADLMLSKKSERELSTMMRLQVADWHGEVTFLLAAIALLNTKNVVEMEKVDRLKINKRRSKDGKRNLSNYHLLKIAPRFVKVMARRGTGESRDAMRAHFVRGHWKTRKTGVFFWLPFVRGNKARGTVSKDYELV